METYVVMGFDRPDGDALRIATRLAHLEYIGQLQDSVVVAGPMISSDGRMIGSLTIATFADRAAAESYAANDPYALAGLFDQVRVEQWRQVLPAKG